jgi:poly-gamma-glutamate synthesis protein (capsule biosynthesis protein)
VKKKILRFVAVAITVLFLIYIVMGYLKKPPHLVIGFTGDVMLGRLVNNAIKHQTYSYPWGNILPLLKENDLNIINLENTFTRSNKAVFKVFNFKSNPKNIQTLILGKIDLVNIANNHIFDFNGEGFIETLNTLDHKNIAHAGAGSNLQEAEAAAVITKNEISVGMLGYTDNEPGWAASLEKPGVNFIYINDFGSEKIKRDVQKIRDKVDIIIASLHWGPNKRQRPTKEFIDFAHKLIDAGVDIIHGHSAHIFQGIEIYKNKVIMYDTGDFVDDYAVYPNLRNDQSFLFRIMVKKSGPQQIELIPVFIENMQVNKAEGQMAEEILRKMKGLCAEFDTQVKIIDGKGIIKIR